MESILHHLKNIERKAYPGPLQKMQDLTSVQDLIYYCTAVSKDDLLILHGPDWYFLATISTAEIIDLASVSGMSFKDLITVKKTITETFKGREIYFEAKEDTSYKFISKIGSVISLDEVFLKERIPFHRVRILI